VVLALHWVATLQAKLHAPAPQFRLQSPASQTQTSFASHEQLPLHAPLAASSPPVHAEAEVSKNRNRLKRTRVALELLVMADSVLGVTRILLGSNAKTLGLRPGFTTCGPRTGMEQCRPCKTRMMSP
jgi:hypothetical protein